MDDEFIGRNRAACQAAGRAGLVRLMRAKANQGASGENAIQVSIDLADFIIAPIGVVVPHSMMSEITPPIAEAVATARGRKLFLPINQPHFRDCGHRVEGPHQADQPGD